MSGRRRDEPEWRKAARGLGSTVSGSARRLARGLQDLTERPAEQEPPTDQEGPADQVDPEAAPGAQEDLGDRMKDLGRDFVDIMGKVSVTAGKKIRKAAWTAADTVRDTIEPED